MGKYDRTFLERLDNIQKSIDYLAKSMRELTEIYKGAVMTPSIELMKAAKSGELFSAKEMREYLKEAVKYAQEADHRKLVVGILEGEKLPKEVLKFILRRAKQNAVI